MNTYLPDLKALWMAENVTSTLHNIYTLRGARCAMPCVWSKYISPRAPSVRHRGRGHVRLAPLAALGQRPHPGGAEGATRLYAHLNNQSLHYANQGVTINQIHNVYELPQVCKTQLAYRGYHGSPEHNSRGVCAALPGFLGLPIRPRSFRCRRKTRRRSMSR